LTKNASISLLTDLELVERSRSGDQQAFAEIVRRYKSKISSTVFGMLGRNDEAEDIGQETFIRFYNSINNFRGESSLGTYLTRIAINLSLNVIKRRKMRNLFSFDKMLEEGMDIPDTSEPIPGNDEKEIVNKAINKLSSKHKSVLVLRLIDEYSTEETAKILNVPVGTVLSRLARAQGKLKEILKNYKYEI
jgi:RNA polymerase sigma-70 factor, ECF subfamily